MKVWCKVRNTKREIAFAEKSREKFQWSKKDSAVWIDACSAVSRSVKACRVLHVILLEFKCCETDVAEVDVDISINSGVADTVTPYYCLCSDDRCRLSLILLKSLLDRTGYHCLNCGGRDHISLSWLSDSWLCGSCRGNSCLSNCWLGCSCLRGGWLGCTCLRGGWLGCSYLRGGYLVYCRLSDAWLSECWLAVSWLNKSLLRKYRLNESWLSDSWLNKSLLRESWLGEAWLGEAWLSVARLSVAWLSDCRLRDYCLRCFYRFELVILDSLHYFHFSIHESSFYL